MQHHGSQDQSPMPSDPKKRIFSDSDYHNYTAFLIRGHNRVRKENAAKFKSKRRRRLHELRAKEAYELAQDLDAACKQQIADELMTPRLKRIEEQYLQSLIFGLKNPDNDAFNNYHILERSWLHVLSASVFEEDGTMRDHFTTVEKPKDIPWLLWQWIRATKSHRTRSGGQLDGGNRVLLGFGSEDGGTGFSTKESCMEANMWCSQQKLTLPLRGIQFIPSYERD